MEWWKLILWIVFGTVFGIIFIQSVILRIIRKIWKFPIPAFAVKFIEGPHRRRFQPPELVMSWMGVKPGMKVLELGPGAGAFTFPVADIVSEVHCIDIQPKVIEIMTERIKERGFTNVYPVVANAYNLPYEDGTFDLVFHVACLPEIPDPVRVLKEVRRVMKNDGIYADSELLPDPDYPLASTVVKWASKADLTKISANGNGLHYVLQFKKGKIGLEDK